MKFTSEISRAVNQQRRLWHVFKPPSYGRRVHTFLRAEAEHVVTGRDERPTSRQQGRRLTITRSSRYQNNALPNLGQRSSDGSDIGNQSLGDIESRLAIAQNIGPRGFVAPIEVVVGVFDQGRIQTKPFKLLKEGPCLTRQFVRTRGNQGADGFLGLANRGFEVSEKLLSVRGDRQHAPARQLFAPKLIDRPENDY